MEKTKIKILYIVTARDTGGAQKYIHDLVYGLDRDKFEVRILYGGRDLRWLSNRTHPWFLFFNDWYAVFELISTLRREKPQILHLNSSKAGVLGSLAAWIYNLLFRKKAEPKIKIFFTAHGWVFNPDNKINLFVRRFYILLHTIAASIQDVIINVSSHDYALAKHYRIATPKKLATVWNGINASLPFKVSIEARRIIAQRLESRESPFISSFPWIGSIGRLTKEKNYETLIDAAVFVPNVHFFIIGEGKRKNKLKRRIKARKLTHRFFIVPGTGHDAELLKAFDVFTMTSIKEGLPYILLEALAAEVPSVVTHAGGMPEVVKNNENGFVVKMKKPELFAAALQKLLDNPELRNRFAEKGRKILETQFTITEMLKKTEALYENQIVNL